MRFLACMNYGWDFLKWCFLYYFHSQEDTMIQNIRAFVVVSNINRERGAYTASHTTEIVPFLWAQTLQSKLPYLLATWSWESYLTSSSFVRRIKQSYRVAVIVKSHEKGKTLSNAWHTGHEQETVAIMFSITLQVEISPFSFCITDTDHRAYQKIHKNNFWLQVGPYIPRSFDQCKDLEPGREKH